MSFQHSPFERVRNAGSRILEIRTQLLLAEWDMGNLDTALKALRDDNGGVPLPNGVNETAPVMRAVFELRPQIMQQAHSLYEREYVKLAPTVPVEPQTATVEFDEPTSSTQGDQAGDVEVAVVLTTSDGLPLEVQAECDVRDLLTGSAITPDQYTMVTPQSLVFPAGAANGATLAVTLTNTGINGATGTVNLDIDPGSLVGAALGAQNTHELTIVNIGA